MRRLMLGNRLVVLLADGERAPEDLPADAHVITGDDGRELVIRTLNPDGTRTEEPVVFLP